MTASTKNDEVVSHTQILFHWNKSKSELKIKFLNPFRTPVAELYISSQKRTWTDSNGLTTLNKHSIFEKWFSKNWWQELGFVFGLLSETLDAEVSVDDNQNPVKFISHGRKIECRYDQAFNFPVLCNLEEDGFKARLDFAFSACDS